MTEAGFTNNVQYIQWKYGILAAKVSKHMLYYSTDCTDLFTKLKVLRMILKTLWAYSYNTDCNRSCLTESQICSLIAYAKNLLK